MRALVLAALCGCKGGKHAVKHDGGLLPADATAIDAAIDASVDASVLSLVISSDGVGPITSKMNDADAFKKALPGFAVTSEHREAEDYTFDEIAVAKDGRPILRAVVEDAKLFKIEVKDALLATAAGVTVGMTAGELAAKMTDLKCRYEKYDAAADAEHVDRALRCDSQSLPHILFDLDYRGFTGKVGAVTPKTIAARKIVAITWLAPE